MRYPLCWQLGFSRAANTEPAKWVSAQVPGAVQLDWAAAEGWGDPHFGDNWRAYGWMEDVYWVYRAALPAVVLSPDQRLYFVCRGVDYRFAVLLAGEVIHEQEGMFTPVDLDITERYGEGAILEVLVFPAPKSRLAPADRSQANQSCKPAVAYGWDFHPRLIPLGIWDETYVEARPAWHIRRAEVGYELADDFSRATVRLEMELSRPQRGRARWRLQNPNGEIVCDRVIDLAAAEARAEAEVSHPLLWWPHDQGVPHLYRSEVELIDAKDEICDRRQSRVGFRRVRLVMHPGSWDYPPPMRFPKSRSHPPITLEINGRQIFAKGSNWVCPDIFPGRVTAERYRALLLLAREANMNLLRCWGGAAVSKESFFDLCDEMGIMVWQEFPLACNRYEGTPHYLRVLDQESRSIIMRLRPHPSVVIWCGGNELFNVWSGMTDQDLALRLLNRNCYDLDPLRPFLPTSPLEGMGHGHYVFRGADGKEVYRLFNEATCTAYTEFGCPGPAPVETLRTIIPQSEFFPPARGTAWESHHAFLAWQPNSHLLLDVIEDYFGKQATVEELVENGQTLQAEGLRYLFEEARRQKPRAAMALNWCFNEPWPCAANMSIIAWPDIPKKAYGAVKGALRPALASARLAKFVWQEGECFAPEIWLLNDAPQPIAAGRVEVFLRLGKEEFFLLGWDHAEVAAFTNLPGPIIRFVLPRHGAARMTLAIRSPSQPSLASEYLLLYLPATRDANGLRPLNQ